MGTSDSDRSIKLYGEAVRTEHRESFPYRWDAGLAGGIAGGVCMGVILHAGANVMPFIGALYGWPTVVGGWAVHMVHSVLIGLLFAALLSQRLVRVEVTSTAECLAFGVLYAAAIGLVTGGLMLPVSMNVIGAGAVPQPLLPVSDVLGRGLVAVSIGVAHLVYGLALGLTYGTIHDTMKHDDDTKVSDHELP